MEHCVHKLSAYNSARASDNPLHKDEAAKTLGYAGGLVPGVDMYAYLSYAPMQHWGQAWLGGGTAHVKLIKPVYENDACEVVIVSESSAALGVELRSQGAMKALASFALEGGQPAPDRAPPPKPMPNPRPAADERSLAAGTVLGAFSRTLSPTDAPAYLRDMRDDLPVFLAHGVVHPGFLLRMCNWALSQNVVLGPWIHTESSVRHHAAALLDEPLEARAVVVDNYERRGHRWVDLDVHLLGREGRPISTIRHIAIYQPRKTPNQ